MSEDEWPGQPEAAAAPASPEQWPGAPAGDRPEVPLSGPSTTPGIPANYPAPQPAPDPGRMQSILHAFGEGAQEGIGPERFGLSAESDAALRKAGIFRGEGQNPIWAPFQGFNEGILRPAVAGLDYAWRAFQGLQKGTDESAIKAGLPPPFQTGFDVAASMGFPAVELALPRRAAVAGEAVEAARPAEEAPTVAAMQQARELGVIGPEPKSIAEGTAEEAAKAAVDHPGAERPPPEPTGQTPWKDRFDEFVGKLKTSDDVKSLIIKSAEENDEFQTARAGDIPLAQAEKLSEATGIATKDMDLSGMGRLMKNDAQVRAAMQVMIKTNDDLHFAMQKVAAKGGTDDLAELAELQEARMRRSLAVEQIAGLRAEWGRTGKAFQDFLEASKDSNALGKFLAEKKGETIDDLRDLARHGAALDPRTQLPQFLDAARRPTTFLDKVHWYWVQGLISGLITHTGYFGANYAYAMMTHGVATPLAAMFGKAKQVAGAGNDLDRVLFGESAAALWSFHAAVPESFITAGKAAAAGLRAPLESEMGLRAAAIARGEPVPKVLARSIERSEVPADRPIGGIAGRVLGVPGDMAGGIHSFYKILGEQASLSAQTYRRAAAEGLTPGTQGFFERQNYWRSNATDDMLSTAIEDAYAGTFMKELGPTGRAWSRVVKGGYENGQYVKPIPGFRWIFPFNHIPINILKAGYEWSPGAFFDSGMRADLMGKNGGRAQDMAGAKMVAGSAIMTYFVHKYFNGEATGEYPDDPKERDAWKLAGKEPNSILIGDEWWSLQRFGPPGQLAQMGANIGRVIEGYQGGQDEALTIATTRVAEAAAHMVSDAPGFQSLQNLFEAWGNPKKLTRLAALEAGTFLPFSSLEKQTASFIDPYMREAKTFLDGIKYSIPGARESLMPKRSWDGQPIENPGYHTVVRARTAISDPVDHEMAALGIHPAPPQDRIGGVKLPAELYDRYQATAGPFTRSALERLVVQPGWATLPAYARAEVFHKTIAATRQSAASAMQMAYPGLIQAAVQNKVNRITGEPPVKMQP